MGQIVVRQIDDHALAMFKGRAKREGLSAEALARKLIVAESSRLTREEALRRMDEIRAMTPKTTASSVDLIRQLRDDNDAGH